MTTQQHKPLRKPRLCSHTDIIKEPAADMFIGDKLDMKRFCNGRKCKKNCKDQKEDDGQIPI